MKDDRPERWDLFISHASEDKATFVAPLARALSEFGVRVWYDEFTLQVGDSLSRSIDKGLARSNYGLVVLSRAFFAKKWPEYELRGLVAREMVKGKVILPVWHAVTYEDVLAFSPPLADKKAIENKDISIEEIAIKIIEAVRPEIFTKIIRRAAFIRSLENAEIREIPFNKIKPGPIQHQTLPPEMISRIRLLRAVFLEVDPHSMHHWMDGFQRDTHPSRELVFWERVAFAYLESVEHLKARRYRKRKQIFNFLQSIALNVIGQIDPRSIAGLTLDERNVIVENYASTSPIADIDEKADWGEEANESLTLRERDKESFPDVPEHLIQRAMRKTRGR